MSCVARPPPPVFLQPFVSAQMEFLSHSCSPLHLRLLPPRHASIPLVFSAVHSFPLPSRPGPSSIPIPSLNGSAPRPALPQVNDDEFDDEGPAPVEHVLPQLASLREPPPSALFGDNDSHYNLISLQTAASFADPLVSIALALGVTLVNYRSAFDLWEGQSATPHSVVAASALTDECLLRAVIFLEPLSSLVNNIGRLISLLRSLQLELQPSQLDPSNVQPANSFWNGIASIIDQANLAEDSFADLACNITDFCDWLDASLTPVLAEVRLCDAPRQTSGDPVLQVLDIHSWVISALHKACSMVKLFAACTNKIAKSADAFQRISINPPMPGGHEKDTLDADQLKTWAGKWADALAPFADSIQSLASVSSYIQLSTANTRHPICY